jgi:YggT family protein
MALFVTFIGLLESLISLYTFIIVVTIVMSWLVAFNVINVHNSTVRSVLKVLYALTEPVLGPIRRALPSVGGLDLSPLVVLIALATLNFFLKLQFGNYEFF